MDLFQRLANTATFRKHLLAPFLLIQMFGLCYLVSLSLSRGTDPTADNATFFLLAGATIALYAILMFIQLAASKHTRSPVTHD